jgi:hypothetical protein
VPSAHIKWDWRYEQNGPCDDLAAIRPSKLCRTTLEHSDQIWITIQVQSSRGAISEAISA